MLLNSDSGPQTTTVDELEALFAGHRVMACRGSELLQRVRSAAEDQVGFVAVAGGDGSIRGAASVLAGTTTPLVPVPVGTRNHFARELGITTLAAAAAAVGGQRRAVDLAEVNGERFVNNSSIGFYAALVRERVAHERRRSRALANASAAWEQVRRGRRFGVRVDGRQHRAWLVFIGNGCYGASLTDLMNREALDQGMLDVRVLRADLPLARSRTVLALLLGRLGRSPLLVRARQTEVEVELRLEEADVALDGEVVRLEAPLRYRVLPGALTVLVPPGADGKVGVGLGR